SIEQFINNFANQPNETNMNNLESDDEAVDTPFVSLFPHSDNDSDDGEVLNEIIECKNAGTLRRERIINSLCHTPRRGLDGIRVQGRGVIIYITQSMRE
ncbi:hypothetical protein Tco_0430210, partial [Tanacetum coccineum]